MYSVVISPLVIGRHSLPHFKVRSNLPGLMRALREIPGIERYEMEEDKAHDGSSLTVYTLYIRMDNSTPLVWLEARQALADAVTVENMLEGVSVFLEQ